MSGIIEALVEREKWARVENCVTLACAAVVISAAYACGGGAASWAGIVFLFNLNTFKKP